MLFFVVPYRILDIVAQISDSKKVKDSTQIDCW
jgi:hypothetical protein